MTRKVRSVPVGDQVRYSITITGDPNQQAADLLKEVAVDGLCAGLLNCGPIPFETLRMYKDGDTWVIAMEATS